MAVKEAAPSRGHLTYKKRLQDCQYWEKKFVSFREEMKRREVLLPPDDTTAQEIKSQDVLEDIQQFIDPVERELVLSAGFQKDNQRQISELMERQHVLRVCQNVRVSEVANQLEEDAKGNGEQMRQNLLGSDDDDDSDYKRAHNEDQLRNFIAGVLPVEGVEQMRRMLYRISRGNAIARFEDIKEPVVDPGSGEEMKKTVFWIVFLGEQLNSRIRKMCDIIHASIYDMPNNRDETARILEHIDQELADKKSVNQRTEESIFNLLSRLAYDNDTSPLVDYEFALHKEKMICNIFLKCHFYLTMIALEGWCPTAEINDFKEACRSAVAGTGHPPAAVEVNPANSLRTPDTPPSYFRLNKFTATFQGIVDTYGIPRYKEANPGLFTVITFPFLFGVMYGDIGHGILLTLFAIYLIYNEAKFDKQRRQGTLGEIPSMAFGGRYVLLLMGMFAVYCGMIYNDVMSIPTHLYTSNWGNWTVGNASGQFNLSVPWDISGAYYPVTNSVYPLGVDPEWYHKQNTLAFFNSMKMKMAVILGVTQMTFGLFLLASNHFYFNDKLGLYFEFIPRFVFLMCTFGYMDFMIVYKWCTDWITFGYGNQRDPPNLIQSMINMFLSPLTVDSAKQLYNGQVYVQLALVLFALASVPFMLCGKPCVHRSRAKKAAAARAFVGDGDDGHGGEYHEYASPRNSNGKKAKERLVVGDSETGYSNADSDSYEGEEEEEKSLSIGGDSSADTPKHNGGHHSAAAPATNGGGHGHGGGEYSFSDEMIHNAIHTIEFVLGCVSNTASYLRLWALSLAHAQLAEVFWNKMIMQYGLIPTSPIFSFIGFAVWAAATFAVLLCMDVLECFLHALRLHWVEFQKSDSRTTHTYQRHYSSPALCATPHSLPCHHFLSLLLFVRACLAC